MFCKLHQMLYFISEYEEHLKSHQKCHMCNNEFKSKKALQIHIMKIHLNIKPKKKNNNNNREILCKKCYRKFVSAEELNTHYYYVHKKHQHLNNKFNCEIESKEIELITKNSLREKLKYQDELKKKKELEDLKIKEELRIIEEFKRQQELKRQEELRKLEELKKQVELQKQEELRKLKEFKKQVELQKQQELKKLEEELKKQEEEEKKKKELMDEIEGIESLKQEKISSENYYYECYRDKKKFKTEKEYVSHFNKYHEYDFPFYCETCNKGFYSQKINYYSF